VAVPPFVMDLQFASMEATDFRAKLPNDINSIQLHITPQKIQGLGLFIFLVHF
jgi:hypothetical protein